MAVGLAALLLATRLLSRFWKPGITIRMTVYLLVPPLIFLGNSQPPSGRLLTLFHVSLVLYGLLVFVVMLVLRYTRRQGFQSSPLDFLILFIALLVPNLPFLGGGEAHMGAVAAQIVMVFFSFEVLLEESRRQYRVPALLVLMLLVAVAVRGLVF
jgi:UDP-GlcNAc:undecaprenyl-phosphate GlcNAc-1-phosphate transferase